MNEFDTKTLEELKQEADALGITYRDNIGAEKLAKKIEDFYQADMEADAVVPAPEPEPKAPVAEESAGKGKEKELTKEQKIRQNIAKAKELAFTKRVVTISSNDKRESEYQTTCYLSVENQYFGLARIVPLDVPVELENCLIEVAKTTEITLHKDEIIDGRRTGNKVPQRVRKFNISFGDVR